MIPWSSFWQQCQLKYSLLLSIFSRYFNFCWIMCWKVTNIGQIPVQFTAWLPRHSLWYSRGCVKMAGGVESSSRDCLSQLHEYVGKDSLSLSSAFFGFSLLLPLMTIFLHSLSSMSALFWHMKPPSFCRAFLSMLWHNRSLYLLYLLLLLALTELHAFVKLRSSPVEI